MEPEQPGHPQGDTPAQEAEAAPQKDTRKYAGKYESVEALESAHLELQTKLGQQGESIKRLESLLTAPPQYDPYFGQQAQPPAGHPAPEAPASDPTDFVTRAEAERISQARFEQLWREREAMARQAMQMTQEQQYWRGEFFRQNPDLADDETLVWGVTREVGERYAHLQPQVFRAMMPTILEEIAGKAREKLAKIRSTGKAEAERRAVERAEGQVPGSTGTASPPPAQQPKTLDELRQQEILEEIRQSRQMREPLMR